jgi:L-amino acid N-acyltransferase YncA
MEIRRAESDGDLTGYAQVWNAITPSEPITVAETKRRLARQPWRLYLVAEEAGRIVGSGFAGRTDSAERAFLAVRVLPEWRRRGIGVALYEVCRPHAVELGAAMISGRIAEHDSDSLQWAANLGFAEVGRDVELVRAPRRNAGRARRGSRSRN